jgi:hypothetical protein
MLNFFLFYCNFYTLYKPAISLIRNIDTWNSFRATKSFYFSLYFPNCFKYRYDTGTQYWQLQCTGTAVYFSLAPFLQLCFLEGIPVLYFSFEAVPVLM